MRSAPGGPARAVRCGRRGFTLLEMLVVITILGVLMAMGAGGYLALSRGNDVRAFESQLESVVRQARNSTIYEGAPAGAFIVETFRLELRNPAQFLEGEIVEETDEKIVFAQTGHLKAIEVPRSRVLRRSRSNRARAVGFKTVGLWHLEASDPDYGFLGRSCSVENCEIPYGKVGTAALLNYGSKTAKSRIRAHPAPDDASDPFALATGGRISLWVHALPSNKSSFLFKRDKSYELRVGPDGTLQGSVGGTLVDAAYVLPLGRWVHVAFTFKAGYAEIAIDDVVRGWSECPGLSPPEKGELVFGEGFTGLLDEIRVQRRVIGQELEIPDDFEIKGPKEVFFDHRGRLDPTMHTKAVTFLLTRDRQEAGFTVTLDGQIE